MSAKKEINSALMMAFTVTTLLGFINAQAVGSKDLFRCRQSCYQKFVQDWHHCMDFDDCKNMCITPPNINSYIPEAFSFLCWNNCDQQLGPFPLNINSALRQDSLVLTTIAWDQAITNASKQCLVTWEVSGGGLMGNLLTDSSTVELSLWPDTVYHVQVTCKHKETGGMRRSYKLIVDTHKLSDSTVTGMQAITLETGNMASREGMMPHMYGAAGAVDIGANSGETDSRMRILKDSSKDFLSPYNPNANVASTSSSSSTSSTGSTSSSTTPTTSDATRSTTIAQNQNQQEQSARHNSVLRTKLVGERPLSVDTVDFLTQSITFAVVGSVVLFVALLVLYMLVRPSARKHVPAGAIALDKEVLIHNELLPSQTPQAAKVAATVAVAVGPTVTPKNTTASLTEGLPVGCGLHAGASDSQTLHV
ncbi:uncharacterized protein LOC129239306 isoform X1 [Anastrepha obliqua]|uniref:uncharacterized protein LOC129239306 isoform X1 n=1 Tax=Anastrepha obliqua TaxID=95512 RepID=UPI0024096830|nr:uncharacterized protein LOC129239306 isoform X1 [Anastrepha obliqua]